MNQLTKNYYKTSEVAEELGIPLSSFWLFCKKYNVTKHQFREDRRARWISAEDFELLRKKTELPSMND